MEPVESYMFEFENFKHFTPTDFIREACIYATKHSDDADTQNGAILVSSTKSNVIYSANIVPGSIQVTDARTSRPLKYMYIEHAERMAIFRAAA